MQSIVNGSHGWRARPGDCSGDCAIIRQGSVDSGIAVEGHDTRDIFTLDSEDDISELEDFQDACDYIEALD
ncbi:jg13493, partial [Pararge aegeria aegeria]